MVERNGRVRLTPKTSGVVEDEVLNIIQTGVERNGLGTRFNNISPLQRKLIQGALMGIWVQSEHPVTLGAHKGNFTHRSRSREPLKSHFKSLMMLTPKSC